MSLLTFYKTSKNFLNKSYNLQKRFGSTSFTQHIQSKLNEIKEAGLYKEERVLTSPQSSSITTSNLTKPVINFCANNYLGLATHPEVIQAAKDGIDQYGAGLASVRFICGTQDIHLKLEKKIAEFHEKDDAILFAACFDANAGIFEALLDENDAILTDKLNHASIIDGVRLSKAKRYLFEHMNMKDLESKLVDANNNKVRNKLIVTDGSFSMDGDIAPIKDIVALADEYNAKVMIDECHSTGFIGKTGKGVEEYYGVKVDIINSTLGKALGGGTGGYITSSQEIIDILRQRARPYLFSNALTPSVVMQSIKVFELITKDTKLRDKLVNNIKLFRNGMKNKGFELMGNKDHPICPVMLKDAKLAKLFADEMLNEGIYVIGFSFPVVPKNEARIRVQISAAHSQQQIEQCIDAFEKVAKKFGVLK